jgi:hypothetical protein
MKAKKTFKSIELFKLLKRISLRNVRLTHEDSLWGNIYSIGAYESLHARTTEGGALVITARYHKVPHWSIFTMDCKEFKRPSGYSDVSLQNLCNDVVKYWKDRAEHTKQSSALYDYVEKNLTADQMAELDDRERANGRETCYSLMSLDDIIYLLAEAKKMVEETCKVSS